MEEKVMMIDVETKSGAIKRYTVDNMEFAVRDGYCYFVSGGKKYNVYLSNVIQVFLSE